MYMFTQGGAGARLVQITSRTMVCGGYNYSWLYNPTHIAGAPPWP